MASLLAGATLEKKQDVEEARLGRIKVGYRNAREEYSICMALGILGRGYCAVARDYSIAPVLLCCLFNGEHQEGLDSTDADKDSLDEESSTGDF